MIRATGFLLLGVELIGCTFGAPPDPTFDLAVDVAGSVATVSGQTTLPDHSRLDVWASDAEGTRDVVISDVAHVETKNGSFSAQIDLTGWSPGLVDFRALFRASNDQPAEFFSRYGADGSGMAGPDVAHDDLGWALQDSRMVRISGSP